MMHRFFFGLLLLISLFLVSCQGTPPTAELKNEVMRIHDEVMPKVHEIHKLTKELEAQLTDGQLEEEGQTKIKAAIDQLNVADKAMWAWMEGYKEPDESISTKEAMSILEKEKEKISKVSQLMLSSIDQAKALLSKK